MNNTPQAPKTQASIDTCPRQKVAKTLNLNIQQQRVTQERRVSRGSLCCPGPRPQALGHGWEASAQTPQS